MDSDGDRMDSSVLPSSCCTEVVWDQAHHVFSIQSSSLLGPFTRFVGASFFILGAFPLHEPQKSKWQPAKFLEARMGCAWHWRKKGLLETNCVLKCSTHVCPRAVCLSAGGYRMWMAGRMEQGECVGN